MGGDSNITFRPIVEADLTALHAWMHNPEVAAWYGIGVANVTYPSIELVRENFLPRISGAAPTFCYIIEDDGRPVGYIQTYRIGDYPEYARAIDVDGDAWGIDLFIGDDEARGGGFGTRVINGFVEEHVFSRPGVDAAIIAPNPKNARAVRCYEKAGFAHTKTVWVEVEGDYEYVMSRSKAAAD